MKPSLHQNHACYRHGLHRPLLLLLLLTSSLAADVRAQLQPESGQGGVATGHRTAGVRPILLQQPHTPAQRVVAEGLRGSSCGVNHEPLVNQSFCNADKTEMMSGGHIDQQRLYTSPSPEWPCIQLRRKPRTVFSCNKNEQKMSTDTRARRQNDSLASFEADLRCWRGEMGLGFPSSLP